MYTNNNLGWDDFTTKGGSYVWYVNNIIKSYQINFSVTIFATFSTTHKIFFLSFDGFGNIHNSKHTQLTIRDYIMYSIPNLFIKTAQLFTFLRLKSVQQKMPFFVLCQKLIVQLISVNLKDYFLHVIFNKVILHFKLKHFRHLLQKHRLLIQNFLSNKKQLKFF